MLDVPPSCFHAYAMDFITNLPLNNGYNTICNVVGKLT